MKNNRIIAIGNAIMDIIIKCNDDILKTNNLTKGSMTLIDDEMANKLSKLDIIKIDCGGSAANTIYCMSQLSQIDCEFIGKVANDSFGNQFIKKFILKILNSTLILMKDTQQQPPLLPLLMTVKEPCAQIWAALATYYKMT